MVFPSRDESSEVVHPGEEPFDLPSFLVAAELAPVLGLAPVAAVRGDHLDAVLLLEPLVEFVGVVSFIADQALGKLVEKASGKNFFNKVALGRRSARDRYGERKTVASGDSDDLGALAPPRRANREAPFFVLEKVASTNASSRLSLPCSKSRRASRRNASSSLPVRIPYQDGWLGTPRDSSNATWLRPPFLAE